MPQGEYKLGVGRIFLKHRAAQMLDALHYFDQAALELGLGLGPHLGVNPNPNPNPYP